MEITIEELKKNYPNWNPTSPEQEQKNARTGEEGSEAISLRSNSGLNEHHIPTPLHNYQK